MKSDADIRRPAPPSRNLTADLLKGTAVLLMIQVHLMELFVQPGVYESAIGAASLFLGGPPVAPLFLAVFGYFVQKSRRSMLQLFARAGKLLLVGLLLNLGMNAHLLLKIRAGVFELSPWEYVLGVDILFAVGLSVLVLALLRPVLRSSPWAWVATAVAVAATAPLMTEQLTIGGAARWPLAYIAGNYSWSYFPLFPWLAYPLLGAGLSAWCSGSDRGTLKRLTESPRVTVPVLLLAVVVLTVFGRFAVQTSRVLPAYYHHGALFFGWTALFLLVWTATHHLIAHRFHGTQVVKYLAWVGRNVTRFYIVQWLIIGNIATALYRSETLLHGGLWFVTVTVATSALVRMTERLVPSKATVADASAFTPLGA